MTGFCKTEITYQDLMCNIEVRSVNHRYLEARVFLPKQFQYLEDHLKKVIKKKLSRGKVDINLQLNEESVLEERLYVERNTWENVQSILEMLEKDTGRSIDVSLSDLLQIKGLLAYQQEEKETETYESLFEQAINQGIEELVVMRQREGELLYKDIIEHVDSMQDLISRIPEYSTEVIEAYKQRLKNNLEKLEVKYNPDDPRIMQEIGIYMDRADITEELERFGSHLVQLREMLQSDEPVGRKLDFMLQELYREANTLCSKAGHTQITQVGVDLKCEIEKIREQVQNIE